MEKQKRPSTDIIANTCAGAISTNVVRGTTLLETQLLRCVGRAREILLASGVLSLPHQCQLVRRLSVHYTIQHAKFKPLCLPA